MVLCLLLAKWVVGFAGERVGIGGSQGLVIDQKTCSFFLRVCHFYSLWFSCGT